MDNEYEKKMKQEEQLHIQQEPTSCREAILSNEYEDLIVQYEGNVTAAMIQYNGICYQIIDEKYAVIHRPLDPLFPRHAEIDIEVLPLVLGPYGLTSISASGILELHRQPFMPLRGNGVIIGVVDTGIDYLHPAFVNEDNTTKVLSIWDQTLQVGDPPMTFQYGTEYSEVDINEALASENPYEIVPSIDENGHGTFLAGVAAGRRLVVEDFVGAAPDADIIAVKLKPAKEYLRDLYLINDEAVIYEDIDIIMGIKYLIQKATAFGRPLVILIGLGTNQGSHDGNTILGEYLSRVANTAGYAVVIAAGNEANLGHHYAGRYPEGTPFEEVEVYVTPGEKGIGIQFWARTPDLFSVAILSPTGEFIARIPPRIGQSEVINLLLEETTVLVEYLLVEGKTGDEFILIRLERPTEGMWTIRVYGDIVVTGRYDMWLEREGWNNPLTQFLRPDPYTTITVPGTSRIPITVGAYNHYSNSIWVPSGRGLTRANILKPELVAPGVNIYGPLPNNQWGTATGTSISAAHVAGAAALLLEWGIVLGNDPVIDTRTIKKLLIRGASRKEQIDYPNREWGFGALNVFNALDVIRGRRDV